MPSVVRIGNACGFWGDSPDAPRRLVEQAADLDYLTLDYLAEVSMSVLAKQRQRDPSAGFPRDFLAVITSLAPLWREGRRFKLVTNAGGLDPAACGRAVAAILREAGCKGMKVGVVAGDDVLPQIQAAHAAEDYTAPFRHLETQQDLRDRVGDLLTANAYLGAAPLVEALGRGADVVVTGRVADPSLTVAPCIHHFGWRDENAGGAGGGHASDRFYDRLAGATVAGHLIECGTQVTGGISTHWFEVSGNDHLGYPIAEVSEDGSCVLTKPAGTGGEVSARTVKEQLLYEIGDPNQYLSPDATVSFLSLRVEDLENDRVRVTGARGRPPPATLKVSATYGAGYKAVGTLTFFGRDAVQKARRCGHAVLNRVGEGPDGTRVCPREVLMECLGSGDVVPRVVRRPDRLLETVLRLGVFDPDRALVERFTRLLSPLITAGPQGVCGYGEGRPAVREVFGYWPTLIERQRVTPTVEVLEA